MRVSLIAMLAVCAVVAALGCSGSGRLPAETTGAFEQAFTRHDLDAVLDLFTDDAQILPQHGRAVAGREEIEQYFKDSMTPRVAFDTETDMTLVSGDLGVEQGRYRVRDLRRGSDVEEGKYLHVWRRTAGGWKLHRIIYNTDVEPRTEVAVVPADEEP
jgi:uncharacterized protein (TIGR02246 family)